jgi:cycloisomaltooligosaccharide glucanotransferase
MFALGGSHLELGGDHMLCKEYFPNENLTMSEELKTAMVHYYDFLTSYQNLLRDGGTENSITMNCTNGEMRLNVWPPQQGSVTTYAKQVGNRQVIHLLNFSQANSLSWRDVDGTMPEPTLITKAALQMNLPAKVNKLWVASPDVHGGALQELAFTQENGVVSFTLPSLKYWTMIVAE